MDTGSHINKKRKADGQGKNVLKIARTDMMEATDREILKHAITVLNTYIQKGEETAKKVRTDLALNNAINFNLDSISYLIQPKDLWSYSVDEMYRLVFASLDSFYRSVWKLGFDLNESADLDRIEDPVKKNSILRLIDIMINCCEILREKCIWEKPHKGGIKRAYDYWNDKVMKNHCWSDATLSLIFFKAAFFLDDDQIVSFKDPHAASTNLQKLFNASVAFLRKRDEIGKKGDTRCLQPYGMFDVSKGLDQKGFGAQYKYFGEDEQASFDSYVQGIQSSGGHFKIMKHMKAFVPGSTRDKIIWLSSSELKTQVSTRSSSALPLEDGFIPISEDHTIYFIPDELAKIPYVIHQKSIYVPADGLKEYPEYGSDYRPWSYPFFALEKPGLSDQKKAIHYMVDYDESIISKPPLDHTASGFSSVIDVKDIMTSIILCLDSGSVKCLSTTNKKFYETTNAAQMFRKPVILRTNFTETFLNQLQGSDFPKSITAIDMFEFKWGRINTHPHKILSLMDNVQSLFIADIDIVQDLWDPSSACTGPNGLNQLKEEAKVYAQSKAALSLKTITIYGGAINYYQNWDMTRENIRNKVLDLCDRLGENRQINIQHFEDFPKSLALLTDNSPNLEKIVLRQSHPFKNNDIFFHCYVPYNAEDNYLSSQWLGAWSILRLLKDSARPFTVECDKFSATEIGVSRILEHWTLTSRMQDEATNKQRYKDLIPSIQYYLQCDYHLQLTLEDIPDTNFQKAIFSKITETALH